MSWVQGIQEREDLPQWFVEKAEELYEKKFGSKAELQYITWFGIGDEVILDFGIDNNSITLDFARLAQR